MNSRGDHIDKGKQERELQARSLHHSSSIVYVPTFVLFASVEAANAVGCVGCGDAGCDPKGVGVLTTRSRYSRIEHRQTRTFFITPRGTSYPLSYIDQLNF